MEKSEAKSTKEIISQGKLKTYGMAHSMHFCNKTVQKMYFGFKFVSSAR
jgi:ABC-type lipopolysaccharide export system ATPase subunit